MKTYNLNPSYHDLAISSRCRCCLDNDKVLCEKLKLTSIDFCIWYDENLLTIKNIDFTKKPFDFILFLFDNNYLNSKRFFDNSNISNFRLACLIFSRFVKMADVNKIKSMSHLFLADNPDFLKPILKNTIEVDFTKIFIYDRYKSNKKIFPYFSNNNVDKQLIGELISRQFIAFDEKYNNIIYINRDLYDNVSIEKHGITPKHFMRLEGKPFPFIYFTETEEYSYKRFTRCEAFATTLELLQFISENEVYDDVVYISLHTDNYNPEAIKNFKISFGDLYINFHFDNKVDVNKVEEEINEELPF